MSAQEMRRLRFRAQSPDETRARRDPRSAHLEHQVAEGVEPREEDAVGAQRHVLEATRDVDVTEQRADVPEVVATQ